MRYHHNCLVFQALQVALEPQDAREVQVVCGLILESASEMYHAASLYARTFQECAVFRAHAAKEMYYLILHSPAYEGGMPGEQSLTPTRDRI